MAEPTAEVSIQVLNLAGESLCTVSLPPESTVRQLKERIACECGHAAVLQQLLHETALEDSMHVAGLKGVVTLILKACDVERCIQELRDKQFGMEDARVVCALAKDALRKEPSMLELQGPFVIGGNLIGCAEQLMYILETFREPPQTGYLFLGNCIGLGRRQIDTLCLLLLYKLKYEDRMHLIRGKQECAKMSRTYGLYDECKRRFNVKLWKTFIEVFDCMPLCALLQNRILCVPSGLSPELQDLAQLRSIPRPADVPESGLVSDLLWTSFDSSIQGWRIDGEIKEFGPDVLQEFLIRNGLQMICCCNGIKGDGFESFEGTWLSVCSSSNYLGELDNRGAVVVLDEHAQYKCVSYNLGWSGLSPGP